MTIPLSNLMQNPVKAHKYRNNLKAKAMSFFAFVFSIVIYISIFYDIFNLFPSTLLSNTNFWFLISNTLILIIAADYGAFSSSKLKKRDLYEEYYYSLRSQARRSWSSTDASSFVSQQCPEIIVNKSFPMEEKCSKEKKEDVADDHKKNETPERILEVVEILEPETDYSVVRDQRKTIQRSKSDKVKLITFEDNNNLQRSKTEKHEPSVKQIELPAEANEFSTMSDEELNRRFEEFIEKFNMQIRLQASARNRQFFE